MTDQTQRLEIATVKAEVGSNILSRFSNDAINADGIPTDSGAIPNLKQVIKSIEDKASVSTSIYPTVAAGLAATAEGGMFLVASADTDEIYEVWRKVSGAAVDTGKRALSSQAAEATLKRRIITTPGIIGISSFSLTVEPRERRISVQASVIDVNNEQLLIELSGDPLSML